MKEDNSAPYFEMPDEVATNHYAPAYRTNMKVPHPTNKEAMVVDHAKVMEQVLTGK